MDSLNNACKLGSDAWLELQAFKNRQLNRREKLNRNRDLINGIVLNNNKQQSDHSTANNYHGPANQSHNQFSRPSTSQIGSSNNNWQLLKSSHEIDTQNDPSHCNKQHQEIISSANNPIRPPTRDHLQSNNLIESPPNVGSPSQSQGNNPNLELVECLLLLKLCDVALKLPIDSRVLQRSISRIKGLDKTSQSLVENLLQKFAHQELITIEEPSAAILSRRKKSQINIGPNRIDNDDDDDSCIYVTSADQTRLVEFDKSFGSPDNLRALLLESKSHEDSEKDESNDQSAISQLNSVPIQAIRISQISSEHKCLNGRLDHLENDNTQKSRPDKTDVAMKLISSNPIKPSSSNMKHLEHQSRDDVESLLSLSSTKERESQKLGEELLELLSKPTAKERNLMERFRSADGYQVQEFCPKGTKGECKRNNNGAGSCDKLHFKKIIAKHTEESLGDCSFLNTCFHMDSCKYVHYEVDYDDKQRQFKKPRPPDSKNQPDKDTSMDKILGAMTSVSDQCKLTSDNNNNQSNKVRYQNNRHEAESSSMINFEEQYSLEMRDRKRFKTVIYPPQWIQCDLRFFDMSLLGKFSVVMADPPWDIHMELPYGTMSDEEMRKLNIPALQDEGVIFLWVTGRAMELGRECLALWGYERCDEIIWVKTNQLQRIIRTGRTGHWLNHGKEHCLVGVKGNPKDINRGLDCDVIVAEVRATSHKPDEIYGIIERLSPGTRKIELFGRPHNVQPNWITLGNQLDGVRLIDPELVSTFKKLNLPYKSEGPI